jgi:protein SPT2
MQQRKTSVDVSSLRKLCPDRDSRDRRTVDEIQRDIRARKGGPAGAPASGGRDLRRSDARDGRDNRDNRDRDRVRDRGRDRGRDRDRDRDRDRRRRSPSSDYSLSPPRKRSRSSPPEASRSAVSAMIQGMFSRGRPLQQYADDDSDGSDMEAGLSDVEMEEKRALRIARREDDEAEREENVRREAKERMKRARK